MMRCRRSLSITLLFAFVIQLSSVNGQNAYVINGLEIDLWPSQRVYKVGESAVAQFGFPTPVTSAELGWHGIGSVDGSVYKKTLDYGSHGVGATLLFNCTEDKIGTWIVELTVFVSLQKYETSSQFSVIRERNLTDNFDYVGLQEMWEENRWYASEYDYPLFNQSQLLSVNNGTFILENNGTAGYSRIRHNVETPIFGSSSVDILDWEVKAKAKWTGRETGGLTLTTWVRQKETQPVYFYAFIFGQGGIFLKRGEEVLYSNSDWRLVRDIWYEFSFQRKGSVFYMYLSDSLVAYYDDQDIIPTSVTDFGIGVGWDCVATYEHASFLVINSFSLQVFSEYGSPRGFGMYKDGEKVLINVTSPVNFDDETRCRFISWINDFNGDEIFGNPALVTVDKPMFIVARWLVDHTGDLILTGQDMLTIQNSEYRQNGSIKLDGSASLAFVNASLVLIQNHTLQHSIEAWQNADVFMNNGNLTSSEVFQLRCYDDAHLTLTNADASWPWIYGHQNSTIDIMKSKIASMLCHDTSRVSVNKSDIKWMFSAESSEVAIVDSTLEDFSIDLSDMNLTLGDLQPGRFAYWDFYQDAIVSKGKKSIIMRDTDVLNWSLSVGGSSTSVLIKNSTLKSIGMNFGGESDVSLHDLPRGNVDFWDLRRNNTIEQSYIDLTIESLFMEQLQLISFGKACVSVKNSTLDAVEVAETSHMSIFDSIIRDTHCWSESNLYLKNSTVYGNLFFWEGSTSTILASKVTSDLFCYGNSYVQLVNSTADSFLKCWENSELHMIDGDLSRKLQIHDQAVAEVKWSLATYVTAKDLPIERARVQVRASNGSLIYDTLTDEYGFVLMNLTEKEIRLVNGTTVPNITQDYSILVSLQDIGQEETRRIFTRWIGDHESQDNPISITANRSIDLVAQFKIQHHLLVVSKYGQAHGSEWYNEGYVADFWLDNRSIDHGNGTQHVFAGWTGDINSTKSSDSISMDRAKTVVAKWTTQHFLSLKSEHSDVQGGGWYNEGSNATFSISNTTFHYQNGTRWVFDKWEGDIHSPNSSMSVLMVQPLSATARWKKEHKLTIVNDTQEHEEWYEEGSAAEFSTERLVSGPFTVRFFTNWSGDFNGNSSTGEIRMWSAYKVSANWEISFGFVPLLAILAIGVLSSCVTMRFVSGTVRPVIISVGAATVATILAVFIIESLWHLAVIPASLISFGLSGVGPAVLTTFALYKGGTRLRIQLSVLTIIFFAVLSAMLAIFFTVFSLSVISAVAILVSILGFVYARLEKRLEERGVSESHDPKS